MSRDEREELAFMERTRRQEAWGWFGELMLDKLYARMSRGDWSKARLVELEKALEAELAELRSAITCMRKHGSLNGYRGKDIESAIAECVDVANSALIYADRLRLLRRAGDGE